MQHPFSNSSQRGIAYYYGGDRNLVLEDSLVITKQCAANLTQGEHVLYLNTLTSHADIERAADSISIRSRGKVLTHSLASWNFCARLPFLSALVAARKVRVVVMNALDFAYRTPQQMRALVHWMREIADGHGCRVVVYGIRELADLGSMGQLKWIIDMTGQVGEWRRKQPASRNIIDLPEMKQSGEIVEEFIAVLDQEMPLEESLFVDTPREYSRMTIDEFAAGRSLKINDLAGAHRIAAPPSAPLNETMNESVEEAELALA